MKKLISILLAVVLFTGLFAVMPLTVSAEEERKNEDFEYFLYKDDGYAAIYSYIGEKTEVVIPETLDGCPVEIVYTDTFKGAEHVTKVSAPNSKVQFIGAKVFNDTAFYKNKDNWENGCLYVDSLLVAGDKEYKGEVNIKEGTTVLADNCFEYGELTKLSIPGTIKSLPEKCFAKCPNLNSLTFGDGVEEIGEYGFMGCKSLNEFKLPASMRKIGYSAFFNTGFYLNYYNWDNGALYLDNYLLHVDDNYKGDFTVKEGTTVIADYAFDESDVVNVYLPDGIKVLPVAMCNNCLWVKSLHLGDGLEILDYYAIPEELTEIKLPDGLKKIGWRSFFNTDIETLEVPDSVTEIGSMAFFWSSKLKSIKLGSGLETIGARAFVDTALKEITIPASVKKIGFEAVGYKTTRISFEEIETEKIDGFVIKGYPDTAAETYAKENGIKFIDLTKEKTDISGFAATLSKDSYTYTGKAVEPDVSVSGLSKDDYSVSYINNINVGTAAALIAGKGNYTGSIMKTFKITKASNPLVVKKSDKTVKYSTLKKKNVTVNPLSVSKNQGELTYSKTSGNSKIKVNTLTGKFTVKKGLKKKTYSIGVKVTAKGNSNYKSGSKTVKVKIKVK